jgi:hypothetical protein
VPIHWGRVDDGQCHQGELRTVADEFAAAQGDDQRTAGQTCEILSMAADRKEPETKAVRRHAEDALGAAASYLAETED